MSANLSCRRVFQIFATGRGRPFLSERDLKAVVDVAHADHEEREQRAKQVARAFLAKRQRLAQRSSSTYRTRQATDLVRVRQRYGVLATHYRALVRHRPTLSMAEHVVHKYTDTLYGLRPTTTGPRPNPVSVVRALHTLFKALTNSIAVGGYGEPWQTHLITLRDATVVVSLWTWMAALNLDDHHPYPGEHVRNIFVVANAHHWPRVWHDYIRRGESTGRNARARIFWTALFFLRPNAAVRTCLQQFLWPTGPLFDPPRKTYNHTGWKILVAPTNNPDDERVARALACACEAYVHHDEQSLFARFFYHDHATLPPSDPSCSLLGVLHLDGWTDRDVVSFTTTVADRWVKWCRYPLLAMYLNGDRQEDARVALADVLPYVVWDIPHEYETCLALAVVIAAGDPRKRTEPYAFSRSKGPSSSPLPSDRMLRNACELVVALQGRDVLDPAYFILRHHRRRPPLQAALEAGVWSVATWLAEHGASINREWPYNAQMRCISGPAVALSWALCHATPSVTCVETLVRCGANVHHPNVAHVLALYMVDLDAHRARRDTLAWFLDHTDVDVNRPLVPAHVHWPDGTLRPLPFPLPLLQYAVLAHDTTKVALFLGAGANPFLRGDDGKTALALAWEVNPYAATGPGSLVATLRDAEQTWTGDRGGEEEEEEDE